MDRRSITLVVAAVLCVAVFAYSQGWFERSLPGTETQSNPVSVSQPLDQGETKADAVPLKQETAEPVDPATE